jgi:signal transduction histidine kinase
MNKLAIAATQSDSTDQARLTHLGRQSAILLHEISNPLTSALIHLEQLQASNPASVNLKHLKSSLIRLQRYVETAKGQLKTSQSNKPFRVNPQVSEIKRLVRPIALAHYVKVTFSDIDNCSLKGDRLKFQQILVNLIINAIEAYPFSQQLTADRYVKIDFKQLNQLLIIEVKDQAGGIDESSLNHIFEPLFTTKTSPSSGLGMGLFIVKHYLETYFEGSISVNSSTKGTCFKLKFRLM